MGGKQCTFSVSVLLLSATHGDIRGYSMQFKVSLKPNEPLDPESVAFLRLGFLPSHLGRTLCALDRMVCWEMGSPSPHRQVQG